MTTQVLSGIQQNTKISACLHESLYYVIKAVNKIGRKALNERLFADENDADYMMFTT